MENEKKLRREIANSNERRRMQSINAGFQSLKALLPHQEGEKLSKVSRKKIIKFLQEKVRSPPRARVSRSGSASGKRLVPRLNHPHPPAELAGSLSSAFHHMFPRIIDKSINGAKPPRLLLQTTTTSLFPWLPTCFYVSTR